MFSNLMQLGGALLKLAVFVGFIVGALRLTVVDIHTITDNSMAPTLVAGDLVALWNVASVDFADVVVCENPADRRRLLTGRVVAMPGVTIKSDGPRLVIGGDRSEAYSAGTARFNDLVRRRHRTMNVHDETFAGNYSHPIFIEQGTHFTMRERFVNRGVFLLGDNRSDLGHDSRTFGEVDPRDCKGQVILRIKPAADRGDDVHGSYLDIIE